MKHYLQFEFKLKHVLFNKLKNKNTRIIIK